MKNIDINEIYVDASEIENVRKEWCFADMPHDIARRQAIVWQMNGRFSDKTLMADIGAAALAKGQRFYAAWTRRLAAQEEEIMASTPSFIQCDY